MSQEPESAVVGPWAKEKLDILERYLEYYTKRLKNQTQWKTIYFDAFAGGGRAQIRGAPKPLDQDYDLWGEGHRAPEQAEFIQGSPRRALDISNPFYSYIFVDADPKRVATLRALRLEYQDTRRIHVREGTADEQIAWMLSHNPNIKSHRGIAFLDPFGAHLKWQSIQSLAKTNVFEVIINFPLHMCLNRLMTVNPDIRKSWRDQLDDFFPNGWYDQIYETVGGLLGDQMQKRTDALERVLKWYCGNLEDTFGFVSDPRLIRNTRGSPLYYLIWAGPNQAGLKGADYIMKMGERA